MKPLTRRQAVTGGAVSLAGLLAWLTRSEPSHAAKSGKRLPEFEGIEAWLNSEPLTIAGLEGQVIGVQFWTFGCINCKRTLPHITKLYDDYHEQGFELIGVHTPEFAYEREIDTIRAALDEHDIRYPVAVDNRFQTWRAYDNRYWPHLFLADRKGILRYDHIGEGAYDTIDLAVRSLLDV